MPAVSAEDRPAASRRGARAFWIAAFLVFALVAWQSGRSHSRVEGIFLADEAEYLLMAERLRVEGRPPILPKRPWGLPLVIAPLLRLDAEDVATGFDPSPARAVGSLALLAAALAAAAIAARACGRWAGLCAFGYVGLQPELVFWSVAFLTDVPTCTLAVLAALLWTRDRPFASGLALGGTLLLRHPALLFIAAFAAVGIGQRRWRSSARLALGLLPPVALVGLLDAWLWTAPFESLGVFLSDQFEAFAPEWLRPAEDPALASPPEKLRAEPSAPYDREGFGWYLRQLPAVLTWPGLAVLLSYPFVRGRSQRRRELDFLLATSVVYLLVLSLLRSKEERYLVTALPLVGAVWGATLGLWGVRVAEAVRTRGSGPALLVGAGGAAALVGGYVASARAQLAARPHQPHGALIAAMPDDLADVRAMGVDEPWKLAANVQVRGRWRQAWTGPRFGLVHSPNLFASLARGPLAPIHADSAKLLEACDVFLLPQAWTHQDQYSLWEWINRSCEVEGVYFEPGENSYPALRFREVEGAVVEPCLWEVSPGEPGTALARFDGGLELREVGLRRHLTRAGEVRVDFVWFVPESWERPVLAEVLFLQQHPNEEEREPSALYRDVHGVVPDSGPLLEERRGSLVRLMRYVLLPDAPLQLELVVEEDELRTRLGVEATELPVQDGQRVTVTLPR